MTDTRTEYRVAIYTDARESDEDAWKWEGKAYSAHSAAIKAHELSMPAWGWEHPDNEYPLKTKVEWGEYGREGSIPAACVQWYWVDRRAEPAFYPTECEAPDNAKSTKEGTAR